MELVIRAAAIYLFVLAILRVSGKRQFSEITPFDFVLLLIISEAVSQGLYGAADYSLTASIVLVTTLVAIDVALSHLKHWFPGFGDFLQSKPTMLMRDGQLLESNLARERIEESDILASARGTFGIENLEEVKHAILEPDGSISIVPRPRHWARNDPPAEEAPRA